MSQAKESLEVVEFLFELADAVQASKEDDGKVNWKDTPKFLAVAWKAPGAIGGIQEVPRELSVNNPGGKEEVLAYLRQRFDLPDDELEGLYEDSVTVLGDLGSVIERWIARRRSKTQEAA